MSRRVRSLVFVWSCVGLLGCGPVIGDACTTDSDCGDGVCLNLQQDQTPGGYCSRACSSSGTVCPNGSACVADVSAPGSQDCLRQCVTAADCRDGYECHAVAGVGFKVCFGPAGL